MKYTQYKRDSGKYKFFIYLINGIVLIVLLLLAGVAIFFVYDKIYSRFLGEKMSKIVKDSMSNYESIKNNN